MVRPQEKRRVFSNANHLAGAGGLRGILFENRMQTGKYGMGEFWRGEPAAVTAFNADEKPRTCRECGLVNAKASPWNTNKDTPEIALARREGYGSSLSQSRV